MAGAGGVCDVTTAIRYHIETPGTGDATALSMLAQRVFAETFAFMNYAPADLAAFLDANMSEAVYAWQIAEPAFAIRVARGDDGTIVGFVKCGANHLPMPEGEPPRAATRELHQLYIVQEAHGSGLADMLMHCALDDAATHGAQALYLSVYVENHRAKRFYSRYDFVEIGANPFHIGDQIDDDRVFRRWM
jgi:diamine N-acetyltransferase